jgi:hypothetical protein
MRKAISRTHPVHYRSCALALVGLQPVTYREFIIIINPQYPHDVTSYKLNNVLNGSKLMLIITFQCTTIFLILYRI